MDGLIRRHGWGLLSGILLFCGVPDLSPAAEVLELVAGPVRLEAQSMGWDHQPMQEQPVEFSEALWVTQMDVRLVDRNGNPLPSQLLCHSTLYDPRNPGNHAGALGIGPDQTPVNFPRGTGVLLRSGEMYRWVTMFKNPFDHSFPEVYLRVRLAVEPVSVAPPSRQALQYRCVTVSPWLEALYLAPPGHSVKQAEVSFPLAGRVVSLSSHLHWYGQRLKLETLEDSGDGTPRLIWEARPQTGPHSEFRMPYWIPASEWHVTPQDRFRLTAEYDNPTNQDWPAMGVIGAYIVPDALPDQAP